MLYICVLRLFFFVGVYIAILSNVIQFAKCLENRYLDTHMQTYKSKEIDIYDQHEEKENNKNMKPSEWVDPFDMLPSQRNSKNTKTGGEESVKQKKQCEVYMQRFINLFLRSSGLKHYRLQSGSQKQVNFDFIITSEDLTVLQRFGEVGYGEDIFAVNDVLTKVLKPAEGTIFGRGSDHAPNTADFFPFSQSISNFASKTLMYVTDSPEIIIPVTVLTVSLSTLYIAYISRSYKLAIFTVLFIIVSANFGITWYRMYQEEMSERFHAQIKYNGAPPHCTGKQLGWYDHLYYSLFGEDCDKYYKKHFVNPMSKVSLTAVLAETLSILVLHPAQFVAKAYGDFITTATNSVPFYIKPIVFPLVCIIPVFFLFGCLALFLGSQISLSPFTGIKIMPYWGRRGSMSQEQTKSVGEPVNKQSLLTQQISNTFESAVLSHPSPVCLMNWPAIEKFFNMKPNRKGKEENKKSVCKSCQNTTSDDPYESGDSSQKKKTSPLKKKQVCNEEKKEHAHKECVQELKPHITGSGDCCESHEISTVVSKPLNSTSEGTKYEKNEQKDKLHHNEKIQPIAKQCTTVSVICKHNKVI